MIARIWRTQVDEARMAEYERYANEQSLPMFRQQTGFLGVVFLRTPHDCAALTFWEDAAAIAALGDSPSYQETSHRLQETGMLLGEQSVEVFAVRGGTMERVLLRELTP